MICRQVPLGHTQSLPGGYFILGFDSPEQAQHSRPGQFFMLGMPHSAISYDPLLNRPLSVFDVEPGPGPAARMILFLIKQVGRGTRILADLNPGQEITLHGPLGRPYPEPAPGISLVLVGGGVGIAPIYFGARSWPPDVRMTVFYGGRNRDELPLRPHFESRLSLPVTYATEDGSYGHHGLVTEPLRDYLNQASPSVIYCCGPNAMMRAVVDLAAKRNIKAWVSLENRMGCGMGICLGCAVPVEEPGGVQMLRVCRDGPVMEGDRVRWDQLG